jgi:hypothetical protein
MATSPIPMGGVNTMFGNSSTPGTFNFGGLAGGGTPAQGPIGGSLGSGMPSPMPMGGSLTTNPTGAQGGSTTGAGAPILPNGGSPVTSNQYHMPAQQAYSNPSSGAMVAGTGAGVGNGVGGGTAAPAAGSSATSLLGSLEGATSSTAGTPGTVTGDNGQSTSSPNAYGQTQRQQDRSLGELQDEYGEGMGSMIYNLLQSGGMNTNLVNQTDNAMIQAMQTQINQGAGNLNNVLGAQGVSGNSSANLLANSNYQAQATAQENSLIAGNYLQQYDVGQQLLNSILGGSMQVSAQNSANFSWGNLLNSAISGGSSVAAAYVEGH